MTIAKGKRTGKYINNNWDVLKNIIVKEIKGNGNAEQMEIDDDLEDKSLKPCHSRIAALNFVSYDATKIVTIMVKHLLEVENQEEKTNKAMDNDKEAANRIKNLPSVIQFKKSKNGKFKSNLDSEIRDCCNQD
ncbi:6360_t:CDS:2 [Gigaspora margarita]|uniref:6360_t:CDS:1 n=1 Tax=Gigaspora margarita TaxID=4874 RepID=A0ABN7ULR6_GIGMA|nr:6360_t:CDS:2 [Gigaspora margarita]